jgi:ferredoxin
MKKKTGMDARKALTQKIKEHTKALGADLVGIASMDRFEGAPKQMDPRYIMPQAKSCIAVGFRVLRGSLRGIEEGTFFSNYSSMGYGGITYLFMPLVVMNICRMIEDMGFEALPMGHQSDWRAIDGEGNMRKNFSKPVEPGKPAPDVMVHLRLAAFAAGLGEIGWSKMLLTPQFGPAQRVGLIFTELELEPDPIYAGPKLCNKCMACVRACPGNAISRTKSIKVAVAGHDLEWGEIDCKACDLAFRGAKYTDDPSKKGYYIEGTENTEPNHISPFYYKPNKLYNTGQAVCGAGGCTRACIVSLEKRNALLKKYEYPFRRKKPWTLDWSEYSELNLSSDGHQGGTSSNLDKPKVKKVASKTKLGTD